MRLLPAATATLALAGAGAIAAALVLGASTGAPASEPDRDAGSGASPIASTAGPSRTPNPSATPDASGLLTSDTTTSIAALADPAWIARVATASGIPERALAAYAGAAIQVAATHPGCGLGWNTLAAIGLVESEHGTIHGSSLDAGGVAVPAIIGIALDGTDSLEVADTDGGALDGDTRWDRALGPMQFIPATWQAFQRDGDGDGIADVQQIDDAALTAATYLCESGGDLTAADRWIAAIDAYNPSVEYNNRVAAAATGYAAAG